MRLFGFEIQRVPKAARSALTPVTSAGGGGWFSIIKEAWNGAWQADVVVEGTREVLAFSAVFSCVTVIAGDIAKLRLRLMEEDSAGISTEVKSGAETVRALLRKPNPTQNRMQFIAQWMVSKLLHGNAYVLKVRSRPRGPVTALYVLDPQRVQALVTENGEVYYRLSRDDLAGGEVREVVTVPASEIIHDTMIALWHPLVGVSPIYACGLSATMGRKIQRDSTRFFENLSMPSGQVTAPGTINSETASRLKREFEEHFSGPNIGRIFIAGDGLKYEPMRIPAQDAQLIEQLRWTTEDVARAFHVPLFKIGGAVPQTAPVEALNQMYYSECLQTLIEALELSLDEGLELPERQHVELDLDGLLRMDLGSQVKAEAELVKGGIKSPDEARLRFNLGPVPGGRYPYLQQQNYSLEALAKRDARDDPFGKAETAPSREEDDRREAMALFARTISEELAHAGA